MLRALTGCTGVGKTELALEWAEAAGAEIISCDSLLFYRGMDIGTAKPSREDRARVTHHLIDVCDVTERMDITRFISQARLALDDITRRGRQALLVGGSGFYLKAFFSPVADEIEVDPEIRKQVGELSSESALEKLRELNPRGLGTLDVANPRRVTRALERCLASGKSVLDLRAEFSEQPSAFADWHVNLVRLERPPEELGHRVELRVDAMLRAGLIDEVRGLVARGLTQNPSAARAIGYREVIDFLEGRLAEAEVRDAIVRNTRALVKKQRTWFRTQLPEHRVVDAAGAIARDLFP